jgi:hypothetical protein
MRNRIYSLSLGITAMMAWHAPTVAQTPAPAPNPLLETVTNVAKPCIEPRPVIRWGDYQGPLQNVEQTFARKLDRKPTHPPHYKPDTLLCSLAVKDKFVVFVQDTFDPMSFVTAAFYGGLDQTSRRDPSFKQGTAGYAKRFAANFAGQTSWRFFVDFAYPTLFSEDPRYYRLGQGGTKKRLLHAAKHVFVAHHDNGAPMLNYSEWLGTATAVALSNTYHPGNRRGFGPMAQQTGLAIVQDLGMDILKEFWPEIVRRMHMPFRDTRDSPAMETHH